MKSCFCSNGSFLNLNKTFFFLFISCCLATNSFSLVKAQEQSSNASIDNLNTTASQAQTKIELNTTTNQKGTTSDNATLPLTNNNSTNSKKSITKWKLGEELSISTETEDLVPTDNIELARKQVLAYPNSPEASFILAVALTRTSHVEEALREVRRARKLAEQQGGTTYFDKMIQSYETMLKTYPNENRVRYGLAWAYYMKAYLLADYSKKTAAWKAASKEATKTASDTKNPGQSIVSENNNEISQATKPVPQSNTTPATKVPPSSSINLGSFAKELGLTKGKITGTLTSSGSGIVPAVTDKCDPADIPQIKKYYELAIHKLDELIAKKPDDVWAIVYRAHLQAEYTGNLEQAMKTWLACRERFPNNAGAYFFLGEGYLKQGNLQESIINVSKAIALRAVGF